MFSEILSSSSTNMNNISCDGMSVEQLSMMGVAELQCKVDLSMKNERKCGCDIGVSAKQEVYSVYSGDRCTVWGEWEWSECSNSGIPKSEEMQVCIHQWGSIQYRGRGASIQNHSTF